ncbi:MAG: tripartite tricarboxylate transporter substrate binding protein [Lachnospiraceae bacterium]|nr:tripartite tricarboxylate transporter substrate binding protein [Candidatus Equihabitans merdae]
MKKRLVSLVAIMLCLVMVLSGCGIGKKSYPTKAIDVTILFGAGFSADLGMRTLIDVVTKEKEITMVANNRTGGGGAVGYQYVLSQPADGYNVCWNSSSISTSYHLGTMPEDQDYTAFEEVCCVSKEPFYFVVSKDAPWETFEDFVQDALANPGVYKVNNSAVGCFGHLVTLQMFGATGVDMQQMFDDATYVTGLVNGDCDMSVCLYPDCAGLLESGDVRLLAVASPERVSTLPDVMTCAEQGYDVDLEMYRGVTVKAGTDPEIIKYLEEAFLSAIESEEYQNFCTQYNVTPFPMSAADFKTYTAEQDELIANLLDQIDMKVQ